MIRSRDGARAHGGITSALDNDPRREGKHGIRPVRRGHAEGTELCWTRDIPPVTHLLRRFRICPCVDEDVPVHKTHALAGIVQRQTRGGFPEGDVLARRKEETRTGTRRNGVDRRGIPVIQFPSRDVHGFRSQIPDFDPFVRIRSNGIGEDFGDQDGDWGS